MNSTATALISYDNRGNLMTADLFDFATEEITMPQTPAHVPAVTKLVASLTEDATAVAINEKARAEQAPMMTYIAVTNGDLLHTRSSRTMPYTHAIEVSHPDGSTGIFSWHLSEANALKAKGGRVMDAYRHRGVVTVVPVTAHPYNSAEAKAARKAEKARRDAK